MDADAQLVQRAKAGDDAALQALVKRHLDTVYAFLARYLGNDAMAEDATQETFVKVWRNLKKFDESRAIKPWLFEIARNTANDILRKKRSAVFTDLSAPDAETAFEDTLADPAPLPPELFAQAELGEHVARALGTLPARDRAILVLRYTEDLAWDDIATAMDAPVNTVKSWHRRALGKLRDVLLPFAP
ncbi:MAG TPA: sigma-70 family RNA polymerase sigma factor [Candidatus Paceibacterota bacterium]|nr:sigma-70 family RNA polymerase sigma factor [Candidatus Paceibacterota bacterium]